MNSLSQFIKIAPKPPNQLIRIITFSNYFLLGFIIKLALLRAQIMKLFDVTLYPNPSNGFFRLSLNEQREDFVVTIHDIRGTTLKTYFFKSADELKSFV